MQEVALISLIAGLSTGLGAIIVILLGNISHKIQDTIMGFAAGTLVGIVSFGLIPEALDQGNIFVFLTGFLLGAITITIADYFIPDFQDKFRKGSRIFSSHFAILMLLLITTENVFEGIAIGASFSSHTTGLGLFVILGILAHNIPEGLVLSLPLRDIGLSKFKNILYTSITGLVEPVFAIITYLFLASMNNFVPFMLAFSAGTITYAFFKDLIPKAFIHCHPYYSAWGLISGFMIMVIAEYMIL